MALVCLKSQVGCFFENTNNGPKQITNQSITVSCSGSGSPELKKIVVKLFESFVLVALVLQRQLFLN